MGALVGDLGASDGLEAQASADPVDGLLMLTVRVRDHGIGWRPRCDSPGLGIGLPLMSALARTVDVVSPAGGGTEVRLTFAVSPAGAAASP